LLSPAEIVTLKRVFFPQGTQRVFEKIKVIVTQNMNIAKSLSALQL